MSPYVPDNDDFFLCKKLTFRFIFMISADYATYEKYVETCLHVKEKTVSA
jgi:hypothetical protein